MVKNEKKCGKVVASLLLARLAIPWEGCELDSGSPLCPPSGPVLLVLGGNRSFPKEKLGFLKRIAVFIGKRRFLNGNHVFLMNLTVFLRRTFAFRRKI